MRSWLVRFVRPLFSVILDVALSVAKAKAKKKVNKAGLDESTKALVNAILDEQADIVKGEVEKKF
jgi:hypothetical protein